MIDSKIKSEIFRTRMLTGYREDWPNGQKGCLWYIHGREDEHSVVLLDTFWRKGYDWHTDDEMLPYEEKIAKKYSSGSNGIIISDFAAIIISYLFTQKNCITSRQIKDDILEIWNEASNKEHDYWHALVQYSDFTRNQLVRGDEVEVILHSIENALPSIVTSVWKLSEIMSESLNITEKEYIENYIQSLTLEDKLFNSCQILYLPFRTDLIPDQDVLEYYKSDDICGVDDELCVDYMDANGGSLFCDYKKYNEQCYRHELARGIVASIVNYCANEDMIDRLNNQYITIGKNIDITNHLLYTPADINFDDIGLRDLFNTYFQDIVSRYDNLHSNEVEYFRLDISGVDMIPQIAKEEYENELKNEIVNNVLYAYLGEEQSIKLRKYREVYLDFLQRKFKKEETECPNFVWTKYHENVPDDKKKEFENRLKEMCVKNYTAFQIKQYITEKEKENLIYELKNPAVYAILENLGLKDRLKKYRFTLKTYQNTKI